MRAVVCREFGPPETLVVEDLPGPSPSAGEVLVEIHAIGVNFTDVLAIEGRSQLKRQLPMIPGVEAAGVVRAVGPGVTRVQPGQRVLGCRTHGTYAEEVLFGEDELAVVPDDMDMRTAAAFYIAAMTVRYALQERARLSAGEILLVLGAGGGAGLAGVEIGKALGARVVAAASSVEKLELARQHGADEVVLYPRGPLDLAAQKDLAASFIARAQRPGESPQSIGKISSVQDSAGYHVILDGVGGTYAEPALRALGWEGRYVSIGFAAGVPRITLGPALFKNADIMGIQPSSDEHRLPGRNADAVQVLFEWYRDGRLRPLVTQVLPLEQAAEALCLMKERRATGRFVLTTSHDGESGPISRLMACV
jgi:NADPH2:quinone reductase